METERPEVVEETVKREEKTRGKRFKKKEKSDYDSRLSYSIGDLIDFKALSN